MLTKLVEVRSMFATKRMWEIRREGILIGTVHKELRTFGKYAVVSILNERKQYTSMAQVQYAIEAL